MNEIFYNIKLTFGFLIIITFTVFRNIKLESLLHMETIGFLGLVKDFNISTDKNYTNDNGKTIYIFENSSPRKDNNGCLNANIPPQCKTENSKKSIKCLRIIREKGYGYVNGKYFIPTDINCLSTLSNN